MKDYVNAILFGNCLVTTVGGAAGYATDVNVACMDYEQGSYSVSTPFTSWKISIVRTSHTAEQLTISVTCAGLFPVSSSLMLFM